MPFGEYELHEKTNEGEKPPQPKCLHVNQTERMYRIK